MLVFHFIFEIKLFVWLLAAPIKYTFSFGQINIYDRFFCILGIEKKKTIMSIIFVLLGYCCCLFIVIFSENFVQLNMLALVYILHSYKLFIINIIAYLNVQSIKLKCACWKERFYIIYLYVNVLMHYVLFVLCSCVGVCVCERKFFVMIYKKKKTMSSSVTRQLRILFVNGHPPWEYVQL